MKHPKEISADGYVKVVDTDKSGNPLQVAIDTDDFTRYVVRMDDYAKSLYGRIDERIHFKGLITGEDSLGNLNIKLLKFSAVQAKKQL